MRFKFYLEGLLFCGGTWIIQKTDTKSFRIRKSIRKRSKEKKRMIDASPITHYP